VLDLAGRAVRAALALARGSERGGVPGRRLLELPTLKILVTGGCGFIGTNLVLDRLRRGDEIRVLDDCSRAGTERNRAHLESLGDPSLDLVAGDVRDPELVARVAADADAIFHLAAQVAVTDSVRDPRKDFEINALGTLNVLEGARLSGRRPLVVYTSTNKVYGGLDDLEVAGTEWRYELPALAGGVPETRPVDFHSPYGCSKGAADLYAIDYARIYGIPTVVFRQSCIYGPWQYGNEDQGWIAHFLIRALRGEPITLYGDGRQVRDVLFVDDLLELYDVTIARRAEIGGRVYNIGGGPALTVSLLEFLDHLRKAEGLAVEVGFSEWRPGDQRVFVSDVARANDDLGWTPRTSVADGTRRLREWLETTGS
jgi:CDP-paratose 2-epimerase